MVLLAVCIGAPFGYDPESGWLVNLVLSVAVFSASFHLLQRIAGVLSGDHNELAHLLGGRLYWLQLLMFVVVGMIYAWLVGMLGPTAAVVLIGPILLSLPAATMVLAIEESFWAALNPRTLFQLIGLLGPRYASVCLWVVAVFLFMVLLGYLTDGRGWLSQAVSAGMSAWGVMVIFAQLGGALRDHAGDLGLVTANIEDAEQQSAEPIAASSPVAADVRAVGEFASHDNWRGSLRALDQAASERPADVSIQRERWSLLQRKATIDEQLAAAKGIIPAALESGDRMLAVQVAAHCVGLRPDEQLGRPLMAFHLVRHSRELGFRESTHQIGLHFLQHHSHHDRASIVTMWLVEGIPEYEPLPVALVERLRAIRDNDPDPERRTEANLAMRLRDID